MNSANNNKTSSSFIGKLKGTPKQQQKNQQKKTGNNSIFSQQNLGTSGSQSTGLNILA